MSAAGDVCIAAPSGVELLVDERPIEGEATCSAEVLRRGALLRLGSSVLLWLGYFEVPREWIRLPDLIGSSPAMQRLREEILRVADLPVPVMLRGETGVGKELVASALHAQSPRAQRPYVCVNMAAIPPSMAAAELFGHGRGAFTGATEARSGYFADADLGTLFLDEIGETANDVQPVLLRAIESGVIQPLGGKLRKVDVRLVAATDSDLEAAVALGSFHGALLRRFGYDIWIPPLRERRQDVGPLFAHFLQQELYSFGEGHKADATDPDRAPLLSAAFVARLSQYRWPGNVRELRNVARRFAIFNRGQDRARVDERLLAMLEVAGESAEGAPSDTARTRASARELSDAQILDSLRQNEFRIESTAAELGVSRTFLHARMNRAQSIRKAKDLSVEEIERALDRHGSDERAVAADLEVSLRGLQLQMVRLGMRSVG